MRFGAWRIVSPGVGGTGSRERSVEGEIDFCISLLSYKKKKKRKTALAALTATVEGDAAGQMERVLNSSHHPPGEEASWTAEARVAPTDAMQTQ